MPGSSRCKCRCALIRTDVPTQMGMKSGEEKKRKSCNLSNSFSVPKHSDDNNCKNSNTDIYDNNEISTA